jgi:hypothetical protein
MNIRRFLLIAAAIGVVWILVMHLVEDWKALLAAVVIVLVVGFVISRFLYPLIKALYKVINAFVPWHRLPVPLAVLNLDALRYELRQENLHDTPKRTDMPPLEHAPEVVTRRMADGSFNDLDDPDMGRTGMRFARNFPLKEGFPDRANLLRPSPRAISLKLMGRETFTPASTLNLLAAAWIQFQVHGWVNHERQKKDAFEIPLDEEDPWPERPMRIHKSQRHSEGTDTVPPTYINTESHWWDQSQIYGSNRERQHALRTLQGGKLKVEPLKVGDIEDLRLPVNRDEAFQGIDQTGFFDNYWIGLSMLHTLFTLEHNAIAERLARGYPAWDDERLFGVARLVNSALIAKIHTVEWTPGILGHPALQVSMPANWWGLLGENYKRYLGRVSDGEELSGIIGSKTDHHTASFAMTEEFTAIYRLHTLIPEEIGVYSARSGEAIKQASFTLAQGNHTRPFMADVTLADLLYSFGIVHPGAITLHNFPKVLQNLRRIDGTLIDLAALDILRDRERGVPRYNQFRRLVHKKPAKAFSDITSNPVWAKELEEAYEGDIDLVDLQVGAAAEDLPEGFGFSDTIFRIFIVMASRRLKSDRFFTRDYTEAVYTRVGLDWVDENGMASVLRRHYPQLAPALHGVANPFAPWNTLDEHRPVQT